MGNCQAVDSATLVIQHPSGKADKLYWPVAASEIMKTNPGHYVALLLTTTLCSSTANKNSSSNNNNKKGPLRITRIKLLKPTDTLVLGHVYRLVTTQEVMKGLWAKKQAKMTQQQQQQPGCSEKDRKLMTQKMSSEFEAIIRNADLGTTKQVKQERHHSRSSSRNNTTSLNSGLHKSRAWQPALKSISEAGS